MHHKKVKRQKREENILLSLKKLDFLSRSQLQKLHGLKSDRNAQRVLKQIEGISYCKFGENIYYLNAKGREIVNCTKIRKHTSNVTHYVMRNHLYIACGCPADWRNEIKITCVSNSSSDKLVVVADALFQRKGRTYIIEVDNTQSMSENRKKIERYRELINRGSFGDKPPIFVWITTTVYRKNQLRDIHNGLEKYIYTIADF